MVSAWGEIEGRPCASATVGLWSSVGTPGMRRSHWAWKTVKLRPWAKENEEVGKAVWVVDGGESLSAKV